MDKFSLIIDCVCIAGIIISGTALTIRKRNRPKSLYSNKTLEQAAKYSSMRNKMMMQEQRENERMFEEYNQEYSNVEETDNNFTK